MTIFCTKCGLPNNDTSNYCFKCGTELTKGKANSPTLLDLERPKIIDNYINNHTTAPYKNSKINELTGVGGWLAFLCLVLMIFSPIVAFSQIISSWQDISSAAKTYPAFNELGQLLIFFAATTSLWSFVVGYNLYMVNHDAVRYAKIFFFSCPFLVIISGVLMSSMEGIPHGFKSAMINDVASRALSVTGSCIGWYLYLVRSKRIAYTYPMPNTHVRCTDCKNLFFKQLSQCPNCASKFKPQ